MAPYSSTLAWKIPQTEDPGRLPSKRSLRVGHNWATSLWLFTFMHWRRKRQPTPVFLPRESQGWGEPGGAAVYGVAQRRTRLKWLSSSSNSMASGSGFLCAVLSLQSCLTLFDPMDVAHQAPLSMGFSSQGSWSRLPCPPPRDLCDPGIEPSSLTSPVLAGKIFIVKKLA